MKQSLTLTAVPLPQDLEHSLHEPHLPQKWEGQGAETKRSILVFEFGITLEYLITFTPLLFGWVDVVDLSDLLVGLLCCGIPKVHINVDTTCVSEVCFICALWGMATGKQGKLPEKQNP